MPAHNPKPCRPGWPNPIAASPSLTSSFFFSQVGFWVNAVNMAKEFKPHIFKHDCDVCHRTGILTCQKCNGVGHSRRTVFKKFDATKITLDDDKDDSGYHKCTFCKGSGVEDCKKCAAKGWVYLPLINVRKFQPHPMFENYHWNRNRQIAPQRDYELKFQKNKFTEMLDAGDAEKKRQEEEAESRKRAERRARKAAKAEKAKKGKDKKDKKDKDGKDKKKKKKAAA